MSSKAPQIKQSKNRKPYRTWEVVSMVATLIVSLGLLLMLPFGQPDSSDIDDKVTFVMFSILGIFTLYTTMQLRINWKQSDKEPTKRTIKNILVLAGGILLLMAPWIISGTFNDDETGSFGSFMLILIIMSFCACLGFLLLFFALLPLELLGRSIYQLIVKRNSKQALMYFGFALPIVYIVGLIAVLSLSADITAPNSPPSQAAGLYALLGIPNNGYEVKSDGLLWLGRVMFIGLIVIAIGFRTAWRDGQKKIMPAYDTKRKNQKSR